MFHVILTILLFLAFIFSPAAYGSTLLEDICSQRTNYDTHMELSNYEFVRSMLSATDFINNLELAPDSKLVKTAKQAVKVAKAAIYTEDFFHSNNEIKDRINDILASSSLANASNYPELYAKFEKHLKESLSKWIPDRDYPQIGYLPKEFLFDLCLGEKEITKYWSEASLHEQREYIALTSKDLVLNYELVWNGLRQDGKLK